MRREYEEIIQQKEKEIVKEKSEVRRLNEQV